MEERRKPLTVLLVIAWLSEVGGIIGMRACSGSMMTRWNGGLHEEEPFYGYQQLGEVCWKGVERADGWVCRDGGGKGECPVL